jgi:hypothetical protein
MASKLKKQNEIMLDSQNSNLCVNAMQKWELKSFIRDRNWALYS